MSEAKPLHQGLFTWPDASPSLLGSRCNHCGECAFPFQSSCRACSGTDTEETSLGNAGTLWTWTIQSFMPKSPYRTDETPETFSPYGVGYVELPCGLKIESRLRENTPDTLRIGMPMELEIVRVRADDEGNDLLTFQFKASGGDH